MLPHSGVAGRFSWPAQEVLIGGEVYYCMAQTATIDEAPLLHVHSLPDWMAAPISWESPLTISARADGVQRIPQGPMARRTSPPVPLLRFAAEQSFFDLPKTTIARLSKEVGCEIDSGDSLVAMFVKLIRCVLGHSLRQVATTSRCLVCGLLSTPNPCVSADAGVVVAPAIRPVSSPRTECIRCVVCGSTQV